MQFNFDPEVLTPLIRAVIEQTLAAVEESRASLPDKIAFSEAEAAKLLSLHTHQLRDERLRGRIEASVGPGKKVLYSKTDLLNYLASRRWKGVQ
jgi:hypothetical protein